MVSLQHKARSVARIFGSVLLATVLLTSSTPLVKSAMALSCPTGMSQLDCQSMLGDWPNWAPDAAFGGTCGATTTTLTGSDNQQQAFNYFVQKGLTAIQAAGILGNLMQESHVNPTAIQSNGVGHGIAQWSEPGRWDTLLTFANNRSESQWALATQLDFMWAELTEPAFSAVLTSLKATTTVDAATTVFEQGYEQAGTPQMANRISYAQQILQLYGGSVASSGGQTTTGQTACAQAISCTPGTTGAITSGLSQTRQNVVCIAKQELATWTAGVQPNTYCKKYINGLNQPGGGAGGYCEEWCADFASWVYDQAKDPLVPDPNWRIAAVTGIKAIGELGQGFNYHNASGYTPRPGDLAIHLNGESHVNIVVAVTGSTLTMIGGDQGSGPYGGPNSASVVSQYQSQGFTSDGISGYVSPD